MSSGGSSSSTRIAIVELMLSLGLVVFFGFIGVVETLLAILIAIWPIESEWTVFSSSSSPDNTLIAENAMQGDEAAVGRVSVRDQKGTMVYETVFNETLPSLFLRWTDNKNLLVLSDSRRSLPPIVKTMNEASLGVSYSTYVRYGAADASRLAKAHSFLVLNPADVAAGFDTMSRTDPPVKSCELNFSAKDGKEFTEIALTIIAAIYECGSGLTEKHCGGVRSKFKVGQKIDGTEGELLTSATVSQIPSYNELPDGANYRAIRGQFLGPSVPPLFQSLGSDTFSIDYNFDFDRRNVRYGVPAAAISIPVTKFRDCAGSQTVWY